MAAQKKKTNPKTTYLHGFSKTEQERLYRQAKFLENHVFQNIEFQNQSHIIEVGCGVGAQTKILLDRFGHLKVQGVDVSHEQLAKAKKYLGKYVKANRVVLTKSDALSLPYPPNTFDGAFICWFLEHVEAPIPVLKEIRRVLKPSSPIYCSEVLNATLYVHPYSPATLQYWFAFNDYQWSLKGDPFVGAKLANLLMAAGYQDVSTEVKLEYYDNRAPKLRSEFIEYWINLFLSGAPNLLTEKKITVELIEQMKAELNRLKEDPDAVFFYAWVQAKALAH